MQTLRWIVYDFLVVALLSIFIFHYPLNTGFYLSFAAWQGVKLFICRTATNYLDWNIFYGFRTLFGR